MTEGAEPPLNRPKGRRLPVPPAAPKTPPVERAKPQPTAGPVDAAPIIPIPISVTSQSSNIPAAREPVPATTDARHEVAPSPASSGTARMSLSPPRPQATQQTRAPSPTERDANSGGGLRFFAGIVAAAMVGLAVVFVMVHWQDQDSPMATGPPAEPPPKQEPAASGSESLANPDTPQEGTRNDSREAAEEVTDSSQLESTLDPPAEGTPPSPQNRSSRARREDINRTPLGELKSESATVVPRPSLDDPHQGARVAMNDTDEALRRNRVSPASQAMLDAEITWATEAGFPYQAGVLAKKAHDLEESRSTTPNKLQLEEQLQTIQSDMNKLLASIKNQPQRAALFVVDVTSKEVVVLGDITWGQPTQDWTLDQDLGCHPSQLYENGFVWLHRGSGPLKDTLSLRRGSQIPEAIASRLQWRDLLFVEFTPTDVVSQANVELLSHRPPQYQYDRIEHPVLQVNCRNVRYIGEEFRGDRGRIWPEPGTLPEFFVSHPAQGKFLEDMVSRSVRRGEAYLTVQEVTSEEVKFSDKTENRSDSHDCRIVWYAPRTRLSLPTTVIGKKRATSLNPGDLILVEFAVHHVQPVASRRILGAETGATIIVTIADLHEKKKK